MEQCIPPHELDELAVRATFLSERLELRRRKRPDSERCAREWASAATRGDEELFEKRLALDGLGPVDLAALGTPSHDELEPSDWTELVEKFVRAAQAASTRPRTLASDRCIPPDDPLPFQELLVPIVHVARDLLAERAGERLVALSPQAHGGLEAWLLRRLSRLHADVLWTDLSGWRAVEHQSLAGLFAPPPRDGDTRLYDELVLDVLTDGYRSLHRRFPVLARLAATLVEEWLDAVVEWLERLALDAPVIAERLASGRALGEVTEVWAGLSDPHNGGRSTLIARFASGDRVVYKPRDLALEHWFFELLGTLNEAGLKPALRTIEVLCRDGYGWVEHVQSKACPDELTADYWRRAGALLAVCYALNATDMHFENILTAGADPVIIDTEMVLFADERFSVDPLDGQRAARLAQEALGHSVLATGLLPGVSDGGIDASGFSGGLPEDGWPPDFVAVNTDRMERAPGRTQSDRASDAEGPAAAAGPSVEHVVEGFTQAYGLITRVRDGWLADGGLLVRATRASVRFLFHATRSYALVLRRAVTARGLRDGVAFGGRLDVLARPFLSGWTEPGWWPIHAGEQRALERLDIPYFALAAEDRSVEASPGVLLELAASPLDRTRWRLASLDESDLVRQASLIRAVLSPPVPHSDGSAGATPPASPGREERPSRPASSLREALDELAELARDSAVIAEDGSAAWIFYVPAVPTEPDGAGRLDVANDGLYEGVGGIALFLAAYGRVLGRPWAGELAHRALTRLRQALRDPDARARLAEGSGIGLVGLASPIYVLTRVADLTGECELLDDARRATALVTEKAIANDRKYDVMNGSAGCILGLLALHEAGGGEEVLRLAEACGRHLLNARTETDGGQRAWETSTGAAPAGMSHGAAGIAYALLRLHGVTGDGAYRDAAVEAIAYEDSLIDPDRCNWADLVADRDTGRSQWCHGGTGIALARMGGLAHYDDDRVRADIDLGLRLTTEVGLGEWDQLCCGAAGRIDTLAVAASALHRPELLEPAREIAAAMVSRARAAGRYRLFGAAASPGYAGSLFQGTAGVGYALLRLIEPDAAPTVTLVA